MKSPKTVQKRKNRVAPGGALSEGAIFPAAAAIFAQSRKSVTRTARALLYIMSKSVCLNYRKWNVHQKNNVFILVNIYLIWLYLLNSVSMLILDRSALPPRSHDGLKRINAMVAPRFYHTCTAVCSNRTANRQSVVRSNRTTRCPPETISGPQQPLIVVCRFSQRRRMQRGEHKIVRMFCAGA